MFIGTSLRVEKSIGLCSELTGSMPNLFTNYATTADESSPETMVVVVWFSRSLSLSLSSALPSLSRHPHMPNHGVSKGLIERW